MVVHGLLAVYQSASVFRRLFAFVIFACVYIYIYMLIAQVLFSYQEFCEVFLVCYGAYEQ